MDPTRPHRQAGRPPAPQSTTPPQAPQSVTPPQAPRSTTPTLAPQSTAPAQAPQSVTPAQAPRSAMPARAPRSAASAPAFPGPARHAAPAEAPGSAVRPEAAPAEAPGNAVRPEAVAAGGPGSAGSAVWHAVRLEALLGDVRDPANPYGRAALWAGGYDALPAAPAALPGAEDLPGADQLARALGPLFRRDLALAHAWSIRPLSSAAVPHPAAALLGPAALLAATGSVLRAVTRIVDGLSRYETAARQWRPVLATVFAELLACQSLTRAALRACPAPGRDGPPAPYRAESDGELLAAVAGYLVPQLALELLGDLELVLNECGFDSHTVERRALARTVRNRAFAGAGPAATGAAQARIVRRLNETGGGPGRDTPPATPPHGTGTDPAPAPGTDPSPAPGTGSGQDTTAATTPVAGAVWPPPAAGTAGAQVPVTLPAAAGRAGPRAAVTPSPVAGTAGVIGAAADTGTGADSGADVGDAGVVALARIGRRLAVERRALRGAWAAGAVYDPADPAARALADRQALLVLADRTCAVREQAARADRSFLGGTGWALLALGRITVRLGLLVPACVPDVRAHVWDELARRAAGDADCDPDCDPDDLTGLPW